MKPTILLTLTISALTLPQSAIAQELEGCFMMNSAGQLINLNHLCPMPTTPAPIADIDHEAENNMAAVLYAEEYCQARQDGWGDITANERGITAAASHLAGAGATLASNFPLLADAAVGLICPEFAR